MASKRQLFRIHPVFALRDAAGLIFNGQEKLAKFCESAMQKNSRHDENLLDIEASNVVLRVSENFACNLTSPNDLADALSSMSKINLIEHDSTKLVKVENVSLESSTAPEYFDAGGMPFLVRRGRNVNLLPMILVIFLSLILQILTERVFNNDIDEAVEAVLRYRLGVEPHESLLRRSRTMTYKFRYENDLTEQSSLPRSKLLEEGRFRDCIKTDVKDISSTTSDTEES